MSYPLQYTPSAAAPHRNLADVSEQKKKASVSSTTHPMTVSKSVNGSLARKGAPPPASTGGTGAADASGSKGISKLKLFSKFSFAKQTPPQHKAKAPQSILSNSIKEQRQLKQKQQRQEPKPVPKANTTASTGTPAAPAAAVPAAPVAPAAPAAAAVAAVPNSTASSPSRTINAIILDVPTTDAAGTRLVAPHAEPEHTKAETSTFTSTATTANTTPISANVQNGSSSPFPASNLQRMSINPTPSYPSPLGNLLLDSDSEDELDDKKLKSEEALKDYCPGGYHPTFIGEKYGRSEEYLIVRKLGWGHFSTVWLAWDSARSRHVAIKIVRSSSNYSEAAMDEITLLEKVNSGNGAHEGKKHVVQLLDHFIHEGPNGKHVCMIFEVLGENMLNLLMRYKDFQGHRQKEIDDVIKGGENEKRMEVHLSNIHDLHILSESYGGLPLTLVKQISKQILLALDFLHRECGIIHTDIKPENILVEIHDVEKLVQLLEFERKSKKLNKMLEKRHNDHSYCLQHTNSYPVGQLQSSMTHSTTTSNTNIKPNNITNNNTNYNSISNTINSTTGLGNINTITSSQRFSNHSCHSLSRSISIQKSLSNNNANSNATTGGININTPMRKNSIPIRSSKPLTSPVETSSVDNFFRSFSFSQRRNPSFSSGSVQNNIGNLTNNSSTINANNVSPVLNQNSSFERHGSIVSSTSQSKYTASILSSPGYKRQDIDIIDEKDDEDEKKVKPTQANSINGLVEEEEEDDIFVDATEPILSISPHIKERPSAINKQHQQTTSLASIETVQTDLANINNTLEPNDPNSSVLISNNPVNQKLVPFPSPVVPKHSQKPSLSIDTSSSTNDVDNDAVQRESSTVSDSSRPSILNEFEEIISVKIADLGNACWYNKHYTPDIQTRQYRSPEVILGGDWGCSADIWSAACVIFELITSDYLFDPKSSASYSRNDDHLAQIVELLQTWPSKDYLRTCSRWREFFDRSGQNFRKIGKLKIWPLRMVLIDEYKMSEELATEVSDFLLPMLEFTPMKRVDAGSMCSHPWIKDVSCGADLGREYGLHGDGIKGWKEEWED